MEQDRRELDEKRMALQEMVARINAGSRETVAGTNADARRYTADQTRQNTTDRIANTRLTADNVEAGRNSRARMRNDTTQRGQDLREGDFWGGTIPLQYDALETRDTTARRGQDVAAGTARRGQDMASGDRENAITASSSNARARNALSVLALKSRQKPNLFGTGAPAVNWADEYDRLYNEGAGPDDVTETDTSGAPPAATPASVAPPIAPAVAPPITPAAVAPPRPAPAPPKAPQGLQPGAKVKLRNGKRVTVTKVNPDGTFEYQ
jgi:hypothetical protein